MFSACFCNTCKVKNQRKNRNLKSDCTLISHCSYSVANINSNEFVNYTLGPSLRVVYDLQMNRSL